MVVHPLMTRLSEDAFYLAKEVSMKLVNTHWSERDTSEGKQFYVAMNIDDTEDFIAYFNAIGFRVKFLPNENPQMVTHARFIPIFEV